MSVLNAIEIYYGLTNCEAFLILPALIFMLIKKRDK